MPDGSHQRERETCFERFAGEPMGAGGVFLTRNKKSYYVEIRPQKWKKKKIWKGKIKTRGLAQYFADAIYHYCGKPPFHFRNEPLKFPSLRTMGRSTPEERSSFVQSIAANCSDGQKDGFIQEMMEAMGSLDFILQGERLLGIAPPVDEDAPDYALPAGEDAPDNAPSADEDAPDYAPSADEDAPDNALPAGEDAPDNAPPAAKDAPVSPPRADEAASLSFASIDEIAANFFPPGDEAGRGEECVTPFEDDFDGVAMYAQCASSSQGASVAGFELNMERVVGADGPGRVLDSVQQRLTSECCSIFDCPSGVDEDWNNAVEELNKRSVVANSQLLLPAPVIEKISFVPGTNFVVVG